MKYCNLKELFDLDNLVLTDSTIETDPGTFTRFALKIGKIIKECGIPKEYALVYFNKRVHGRDILSIVIRGHDSYGLYTTKRPTAIIKCEDLSGEKMVEISYKLSKDIVNFFLDMFDEANYDYDMHYIMDLGTKHMIITKSDYLKSKRTSERVF